MLNHSLVRVPIPVFRGYIFMGRQFKGKILKMKNGKLTTLKYTFLIPYHPIVKDAVTVLCAITHAR